MHWYTQEGEPAYTVLGANGKVRPTNLGDARKLNLVPSVTTVMRVLDKPALTRWLQSKAALAAEKTTRNEGEEDGDYVNRVLRLAGEESAAAASTGTDIHDALEAAIQGREVPTEWSRHCAGVLERIHQIFGEQKWIAEKSFASTLGFGGKLDLSCTTAEGVEIVVDYKTKPKIEPKKQLAFSEHQTQLAAYLQGTNAVRSAKGWENCRGVNIFVGVEDREIHVHEWSVNDLIMGWMRFESALRIWQIDNRMQKND